MKATYFKHTLDFKQPSGTSRGVLKTKDSWFIKFENDVKYGIGECGLLRGLSIDPVEEYESTLHWVCENIHLGLDVLYSKLVDYPSIQFGLEMAFNSFSSSNPYILFLQNLPRERREWS